MKKLIALLLAVVMMAAISAPAFATALDPLNTGVSGVEVSYDVDVSWSVSVPDSVALGTNKTKNEVVSATGCHLEHGDTLTISVASTNGFKLVLTTNAEKSIAYTIDGASSGTITLLTVEAGSLGGSRNDVAFEVTGDDTYYAGTYKDTLTFTVNVG